MSKDSIVLKIPAKPEYVMSLRLFVSGIATAQGFDIEELEALKLSISELLVMAVRDENEFLNLEFYLKDKEIELVANVTADDRDNLSLKIVESLSDNFETNERETRAIFKKEE